LRRRGCVPDPERTQFQAILGDPMRRPYSVLLIKPRHNEFIGHAFPPLGAMCLASYIRRHADIDVRIIHMTPWPMSYGELDYRIRSYRPDLVGISAMTFESKGLHRAAGLVKAWRPEVPVIVGGPHATTYTERVLADPNVDVAAIGEGEVTFDELIGAIRQGKPLRGVPGIAYRDNGEITYTAPREQIADLDALPMAAWDLIPIRRYKHFYRFSRTGTRDYGVLFTSRGCPYRCVYCHRIFGKKFRARSAPNVFEEIRTLYTRYAIREFEVIDDVFNLDRSRLEDICDRIIRSGMRIRLTFPNGVRGDLLNEELIKKLRRAGTRFMTFAVETASPRLQELIGKNIDLDKIKQNIELALKQGIFCQGFFMLGFPTETEHEMRMTVDFALASDLHAAQFFVVNAYEGTPLARWAAQIGKPVIKDFDRTYLTRDFDNLTDVPDARFLQLRAEGTRRFWLNPRRIWRIVRDYPDKGNLPTLLPTLVKRLALYGQGH